MPEEKDKLEGGEIVVENRFLKWLDNFWYHYKWTVIVVGFFLIVAVIGFVQCASNQQSDLIVTYTGDHAMSNEEHSRLVKVLESLTPEKKDGAGRQSVKINTYLIYDPEKSKESFLDENGELYLMGYNSAMAESKKSLQAFDSYVGTGDSAIYLISAYAYSLRPDLGTMMRPLSTLCGDAIPESAQDGYAIRLSETAFYQYYQSVLGFIPADTLLLMPAKTVFTDETAYTDYEALWYAIVNFQAP